MRPLMQTNALQQHEINRQHQHQQQQQQQQQQLHQLQTQITVATTLPTTTNTNTVETNARQQQLRDTKSQSRELLVENHLNSRLIGALPTKTTTTTTLAASAAVLTPSRVIRLQQEQFARFSDQSLPELEQCKANFSSIDDNTSIELLEQSPKTTTTTTQLRPAKLPPPPPPARRAPTIATIKSTTPQQQHLHSINHVDPKRYSLNSQYSRSSSSDDASSNSLSSNSRANTFDDAAEHFIINFPADTPEQQHTYHSDSILNLPLSETEPLLTNIEATVVDAKRSICLNKNSGASLVFTRKDIQQQQQQQQEQQQQQQQYLSNTNNNNRRASVATTTPRTRHHSLRAVGEPNQKKTKHLPATYNRQHQQRRSLQLNYNNNLVTTTACGANNNYCSSGTIVNQLNHTTGKSKGVLHKQHSGLNNPVLSTGSNNKTAAATRKQHAYSWYAPVYTALEEELEQDSRDSSPLHNLAQTKQKLTTNHYQQRAVFKPSLSQTENETVALLETRNQINIQQAQLSPHINRDNSTHPQPQQQQQQQQQQHHQPGRRKSHVQTTNNLAQQQKTQNGFVAGNNNCGSSDLATLQTNIDDGGPHAGSLGLAGGPLPRRRRFENFLKSLVGLKSATTAHGNISTNSSSGSGSNVNATPTPPNTLSLSVQRPISPEITITRTPSEQNLVILRDPAAHCERNPRQQHPQLHTNDKLAYLSQPTPEGSTSSLNVVQQKLWNIMRRDSSATSLHQEKSQSIVQYTAGMRKCETVLALSRQTASPTMLGNDLVNCNRSANSVLYTGSGIFNANGIEQIRPLNRLRTSVTSINCGNTAAACSRCSSLLSLAATDSRYSLNFNKQFDQALSASESQQQLQYIPAKIGTHQQQQQQQEDDSERQQTEQQRHSSTLSNSSNLSFSAYKRLESDEKVEATAPAPTTAATKTGNTNRATIKRTSYASGLDIAKIILHSNSQSNINNTYNSSACSPSNIRAVATLNSNSLPTSATPTNTPNTPSTPTAATVTSFAACLTQQLTAASAASAAAKSKSKDNALSTATTLLTVPTAPLAIATTKTFNQDSVDGIVENDIVCCDAAITAAAPPTSATAATPPPSQNNQLHTSLALTNNDGIIETHSFEPFTCKLCLVDVDTIDDSTTLQQCGCRFCTECMKAYVEFEISEAAYEISCPDAQCPTQGIMNIAEIAHLTTANLMKKHHRYRLNREIELDKTRTWCPRAGCETICQVGPAPLIDPKPSTSAHKSATTKYGNSIASVSVTTTKKTITFPTTPPNGKTTALLWAVQCPSCKDEFCSACKKTWHPNISCEEHSRRLVADGQDDIGIPFDNDLIKCCPMCAVPIEKDEGCAQMMCKRCKHVFCWYCLASLDDDFLLRHYDKGPCKNKLGHSRASVVWHRAQVIGIFAGFGILLLVASPLLLLAAPCIICCKCRSCSGSKIDDGDDELDEGMALQS